MNWIPLTTDDQLQTLIARSATTTQLIYKHSTRCQVSTVVKNRLEKSRAPTDVEFHYLDLLRYRELSDKIARDFSVQHESPQVLLIRNGQCNYNESHLSIRMDEIEVQVM